MTALTSSSFKRLVQVLKKSKKTCTVVEQCCGGTINTSIMAQPGASSVFYGGSIAYNTKKAKGLLLNDEDLHESLMSPSPSPSGAGASSSKDDSTSPSNDYIQSKFDWTAKTSVAFCKALDTDYAIAEGGAAGPTFGPDDMDTGFAVLSVAGRGHGGDDDSVKVLKQKVVHSTHNNREQNMRLFADAASKLLTEVIEGNDDSLSQTSSVSVSDDTNVVLDRATALRSDPQALVEMEPQAKYVIVKKNEILFRSSTELALLSHDDVAHLKNDQNQMTFLGRLSDESKTPLFGIDILKGHVSGESDDKDLLFDGCAFADTRTNAPLLPPLQNELALHMMAYANWQRRSCFCASCGAPLTLIHAGTAQQCTACKALSWPRQDPSMIASITSRCGERILLARSKRHPPKMHTVLAGFVEAGETFEAAVARETWEETGIRIDEGSVQYIGSQPWPFPQSCMIAFTATADENQPLNIDENELVDAKWFDRHDVLAATKVEGAVMQKEVAEAALAEDPTLSLLVPPKRVIARTLIDTWLQRSQ